MLTVARGLANAQLELQQMLYYTQQNKRQNTAKQKAEVQQKSCTFVGWTRHARTQTYEGRVGQALAPDYVINLK